MDRELAVRELEVDDSALRAAAEATIDVSASVHGATGSDFRPAASWTRAAESLSTALGRAPICVSTSGVSVDGNSTAVVVTSCMLAYSLS